MDSAQATARLLTRSERLCLTQVALEIGDLVTFKETIMFSKIPHNVLRYVLWADAISCLACGLLQVTFTRLLSQHLGLSPSLMADTGLFLLVYGIVVAFLALRLQVPAALVWPLIVGNVTWGVAAVGILLGGHMQVTLLGNGYIIAQALTVLILARLQYRCVRPCNKLDHLAPARRQSNQ